MSWNFSIGSGNQLQAINCTNVDLYIVNQTIRNKYQLNVYQNSNFVKKNVFKMVAILFWPECIHLWSTALHGIVQDCGISSALEMEIIRIHYTLMW